MQLQESGEMYLETILILSQKSGTVRAVDICNEMGFSKPSVSRAMGLLKDGGFVEVAANGSITLTADGLVTAQKIYARHTILTKMLLELGVDEEHATEDACRMEHVISDTTFEAIKNHVKENA